MFKKRNEKIRRLMAAKPQTSQGQPVERISFEEFSARRGVKPKNLT